MVTTHAAFGTAITVEFIKGAPTKGTLHRIHVVRDITLFDYEFEHLGHVLFSPVVGTEVADLIQGGEPDSLYANPVEPGDYDLDPSYFNNTFAGGLHLITE